MIDTVTKHEGVPVLALASTSEFFSQESGDRYRSSLVAFWCSDVNFAANVYSILVDREAQF